MPSSSITLVHGAINGAERLAIELIEPADHSQVVRIVWPTAPTITTPARYNEVAGAAIRLLANASTTLAAINARKRL